MAVRHAVLPLGAVLVFIAGVYLFVEVRAQPAPPAIASQVERASRPSPVVPHGAPAREASPAADRRPSPRATAVAAAPVAQVAPVAAPSLGSAQDPGELTGAKLEAVMTEANKAYDRNDYDEARQIASRVLAQLPTNVRMLRVMVSASCIDGDAAVAQAHFAKLPPADQEQMKVRCARYGVAFADSH